MKNHTPEITIGILTVIIAAIALIPQFGQWLFPREPVETQKSDASASSSLGFLADLFPKPSIHVDNHLAQPAKVYIEDTYRATIPAYSSKTFLVDNFPVKLTYEVVKIKTSDNTSIGDNLRDEWASVDKGETVHIQPSVGEQDYFYPIIVNNSTRDCSISVNDGLKSENRPGAVVHGKRTVKFGYYKLFSNSNVTLYCDDNFVFWWGNKEGEDSSKTPLHQLIRKTDGVLYFTLDK